MQRRTWLVPFGDYLFAIYPARRLVLEARKGARPLDGFATADADDVSGSGKRRKNVYVNHPLTTRQASLGAGRGRMD